MKPTLLTLWLRNIAINFVVALAYFLIGLLSLQADPIGIVMLPTGLALTSVLLLGVRTLPGVATGSFITSMWAFNFAWELAAIYFAAAFGACWGAVAGAFLIRKVLGFPEPLLVGKNIALFMLLGGPVSCIFPAALKVFAMYYSGVVAGSDALVVWFSFWLGEILGVLIVSPLLLIYFAEPQNIWRRRRASVAAPIVFTFILVMLLFAYLKHVDRQLYTAQLKETAGTITEAIQHKLDVDIQALYGLRNYLLNANDVRSKTFIELTNRSLSSLPEVQAVVWADAANLASQNNNSLFTVYDSQIHANQNFKSIDFFELKKHLVQSADNIAPKLVLSEGNIGYLIVPLAPGGNAGLTPAFPVLVALISIDTLVHQVLTAVNRDDCTITISTLNTSKQEEIVFSHGENSLDDPYQTLPVAVLDQKWHIDFYHNWHAASFEARWPFGWIMIVGLCFTGLLGSVLLYLTGRYFRSEAIIEDRANMLMKMKIDAEQANQAKNHFLAKISHELRTPLNGILGFTQLLEKRPMIDTEEKKIISIIKQCSDDLLRLINDILDISAIESKQTKIEKDEFNLKKLIGESVNICQFKANEKGLELIVKDSCEEQEYLGDEKRIRQILVNLLDNAVKYTSRGRVILSARYENGRLKLTVEDTGCGISPANLQKIFKPFVQVSTDNFSQEGIGLGLAISKELVNLMQGEVNVKSHQGVGSVFTVLLPLEINIKKSIRTQASVERKVNDGANVNVLLVDDNKINLLFMNGMLQQIGCSVDSAKDGLEALVLIEQNSYDVALIDINMPIINGFELAKKLKQQNCGFPLIAVSAYADQEKINEARGAGFNAYLIKPVEERELREIIKSCKGNYSLADDKVNKTQDWIVTEVNI